MLQVLNRELAAADETQPAPAYSSAAKPQQVVLYSRAAARSEPIRQVCTRLFTKLESSLTG
jgi:hypothetical protein